MNLGELIRKTRVALAGVPDPAHEARILVEHFTGTSRTDAVSKPQTPVGTQAEEAVRVAIARRLAGEPVHRILGFRDFYGLRLLLSADTLEPRPDTETLVDAMLPFLRQLVAREGRCRILDLGTGTGAIALALLAEVPQATAVGVDISADALATAARNARENGLSGRFETVGSDWFENISGRFHVIVANPPYIPTNELETLQGEVRKFDPARALDGGADGLDAYRKIAGQAEAYLETPGRVAVETGYTQKEAVIRLFEAAGFSLVEARKDLGGRDRVLVFGRG